MAWFLAPKKVNMLNWIKTLYSNQAIVNYRRLSFWRTVVLFLLVNLLVSTPFLISSIQQDSDLILESLPKLEEDMVAYFNAYPNCELPLMTNCEGHTYQGKSYDFIAFPNEERAEFSNTIIFDFETLAIYDKDKQLVVYGFYPNVELTFSQLSQKIVNEPEDYLGEYLSLVNSSLWTQRYFLQYLLLLVQNLIYVVVIAWLFLFVSTIKPKPFKYLESLKMMTQLMFSPALITALFGMISLNLASFSFTTLLIIRIIVLYQSIIYRKVKFEN
jgi:hypothetical protein